jgi:hypothetical protein
LDNIIGDAKKEGHEDLMDSYYIVIGSLLVRGTKLTKEALIFVSSTPEMEWKRTDRTMVLKYILVSTLLYSPTIQVVPV